MQGTSPTALLCACSETRAGQACTARERSPEGALHGGTQERKICLTSSEPEEWLWPCWDPAEGPRLDLLGARLMGRSMLLATDIPDRRAGSCLWCCTSRLSFSSWHAMLKPSDHFQPVSPTAQAGRTLEDGVQL